MRNKSGVRHKEPPDGGWGWLVVLGAHVAQAFSLGLLTSCGPIIVEWLQYFQTSTVMTTWVFSLTALVAAFATPLAGGAAVKFEVRPVVILGGIICSAGLLLASFAQSMEQLFVFIGVITGLGIGLIYVPSLIIVGSYFSNYYTLANGLVFLGICTGQLIFSPLFVYLNKKFGWRGALLIFAAISANNVACGAIFRPLNKRTNVVRGKTDMGNEVVNGEGFQEKRNFTMRFLGILRALSAAFAIPVVKENSIFAVYLVCTFCLGAAYFVPLTHLVNKAVVGGITKENAAFLMSIMGVGSLFGRAGHGWFVDKKYISAQTLMLICMLSCMVETLTFVLTNIYNILAILCFLFGLHTGVVVPLTFVIPRLLVKPDQVSPVIGLGLLVHALGNAVGPVIAAWLYDWTHDYQAAFFTAAATYVVAVASFIPVVLFLSKQHKYGAFTELRSTILADRKTKDHQKETTV